jgi:hypothetical protein
MRSHTADYITRTDSNGVFRFHNLVEKDYKLLVLDDKNQNKIYDLANEGIGFSNKILTPYAFDSTAREKLLKHNFYYTDFVEQTSDSLKQTPKKLITDTLFTINKYEKDTVAYYKGSYQLVFKDTLSKNDFSALLINNADTLKVGFEKKNDTLYSLNYTLQPSNQYEIIIEKKSITNIYAQSNRAFKHKFYYSSEKDYGTLIINLKDSVSSFESCCVFYLYDMAGKLTREEKTKKGQEQVCFKNLKEGTYKVKLAIDENCNEQWDKSNFELQQESEKVLIFGKQIMVKRGWIVEQEWNILQ